jgi:hypothetical protein
MAEARTLGGRWRVIATAIPYLAAGDRITLVAGPDGLELAGGAGSPGSVVPWNAVEASAAWDTGFVTIDLGDGTSVALRPEDGAEAPALLAAIREWRDSPAATRRSPFAAHAAGPDRVLVVYPSGDVGDEIDPTAFLGAVAADAQLRAEQGWTLVSLVALPLRHAGTVFGQDGSGYATKAAIGGLYARA